MPWHSALLFLNSLNKADSEGKEYNFMERNISELTKLYNEQSKAGESLANGEIEARDCLDICDCCSTSCLCASICADCF